MYRGDRLTSASDFAALFRLNENRTDDVSGRRRSANLSWDKKKLAKLAAGWCTNEERRELIRLLQQQPDLISARVREIRILRESPK
jgi:hypothetical protein